MGLCFARRDGLRLAYRRTGRRRDGRPPVVLIQGLGLPAAMWLSLPPCLAREGLLVVAPDNRGIGLSDAPRRPLFTTAQLAADVAKVISEVGEGPALVAGISLGGMIAQQLAIRHPDQVAGLVLAATTCGPPHGKLIGASALAVIVRSMLSESRATRVAVHRKLVHADSLAARPELFAPWEEVRRRLPPPGAVVAAQLLAAGLHSTGHLLKRIACPTEVITGDADEVIRPANSQVIARRIPGAVLTLVPRAGHVFPMERPGALAGAIRRVCQRVTVPWAEQRPGARG